MHENRKKWKALRSLWWVTGRKANPAVLQKLKICIKKFKLSIKSERYIIRLSKDDNNLSISYNDKNISINSVINDTLWKNFNDEIYINGRYLLDSLNNIGADEIILSYRNSKTPLFLTNRNDIDIIMPTKKID